MFYWISEIIWSKSSRESAIVACHFIVVSASTVSTRIALWCVYWPRKAAICAWIVTIITSTFASYSITIGGRTIAWGERLNQSLKGFNLLLFFFGQEIVSLNTFSINIVSAHTLCAWILITSVSRPTPAALVTVFSTMFMVWAFLADDPFLLLASGKHEIYEIHRLLVCIYLFNLY